MAEPASETAYTEAEVRHAFAWVLANATIDGMERALIEQLRRARGLTPMKGRATDEMRRRVAEQERRRAARGGDAA